MSRFSLPLPAALVGTLFSLSGILMDDVVNQDVGLSLVSRVQV